MKNCLFLMVTIYAFSASAKVTDELVADFELNEKIVVINVNEDGSSTITEKRTLTALNEKGRSTLALESIRFVPDYESIKLKWATSTTDKVISRVDTKAVHERPVSGANDQGISGARELVIPFNNLKVGSKIQYEFVQTVKKTVVPGAFSMRFVYGLIVPENSSKIVITSPKKILYAVSDHDNALLVNYVEKEKKYQLTIEQKKPVFKLSRELMASFPKATVPHVEVSTAESWSAFAKYMTSKYEKSLGQAELPPGLKKISEKAKSITDPYQKIDLVTSELASIMTYSGNWTTLEKMFFPKSLAEIDKLKIGDCKDFATATTAILRSLGMTANVAFVHRFDRQRMFGQILSQPINDQIPLISLFNHAIVHVVSDGSEIWVDPTNIVSNSKFTYSDIAGSSALILKNDSSSIVKVPDNVALETQSLIKKTIKVNADNTIDIEGTFSLTGEYAKELLEVALYRSSGTATDAIVYMFGSESKQPSPIVEGIDFKSRIARSIDAKIKVFGEKRAIIEKKDKTYLSVSLPLRMVMYAAAGSRRTTDFYMGPPAKDVHVTKVLGWDFGADEVGCYTITPWYRVDRKLIKIKEGFEIRDEVHYVKSTLSAEEINHKNFQFNISDITSDCMRAQSIEIVRIDPLLDFSARLSEYTKENIEKLVKVEGPEGITADRKAYSLLNTLLDREPNNKDFRVLLYRVLANINFKRSDIDRSEYYKVAGAVIDKLYEEFPDDAAVLRMKTYYAIRIEKFDDARKFFKAAFYASEKGADIYELGGYLSQKTNDFGIAESSYKKALTYLKDPVEVSRMYSRLAEAALGRKDSNQSIEYYRLAIQTDASDGWLFSRYLKLLNDEEKWDDAISVGEKMLKIADFGVGRRLLGEAYSGKADSIWQGYLGRPKRFITDPEQDVVAGFCMKALKYDEEDDKCLWYLGFFAYNTARVEGVLEKAEQAYAYFSRAVASRPSANNKKFLNDTAAILSKLRAQKRDTSSVPGNIDKTSAESIPQGQ